MSLDHNIQYFDEHSNDFDPGVTTSARAAAESEISYSSFWKNYAPPESAWKREIDQKLVKLTKLPANWDGYGSPPLSNDVRIFALTVLESCMHPEGRSPLPQVVPSAGGGVQLEWHQKDIDLELSIVAPYQCELWFQDHRQSIPNVSKELSAEFSDFKTAIVLLTTR